MKKSSCFPVQRVVASSLLVSMLGFTAYGPPAIAQAPVAAPTPAAPSAYSPPTADQLQQMVAPIALFPDQLVALVLAGSTYPDQLTSANALVTQNPNLTGASLVSTADQQPWDPSVKALTGFPAVLSQMASNMNWTTALGQAYYNDPTDVLNAVQAMRQRALAAGHLKSTQQLTVSVAPPQVTPQYVPAPDVPLIYDGPAIIPPPPETIVIAPAQPDVVYVPYYNPAVVYGAPVAYYPGYTYAPPVFAPGRSVTVGVISFGAGIVVGAAIFGHVGWGWHNWGMHWAPPPRFGPSGPGGGWRPSVVYNHTTYISRTTTNVINQYNNKRVINNYGDHRPSPQQMRTQQINEQRLQTQQMHMRQDSALRPGMHPAMHDVSPAARPGGAMTMPHFNAGDARPGARPSPVEENHAASRPAGQNRAAIPTERGTPAQAGHRAEPADEAPRGTPRHEARPAAPARTVPGRTQPAAHQQVPHEAAPRSRPSHLPAPHPQPHPASPRTHPVPHESADGRNQEHKDSQ